MEKVLVTGGAGYLGSILVPNLLKEGYQVRVLDNLSYGGTGLISSVGDENFEFVKGDVRNEKDVEKSLQSVDTIIHLAAIVGLPACKKDPKTSEAINVGGTKNILKYRNPNQLLIFASTISNYGDVETPGQVCTEETPLKPNTEYAYQKTEAEQLVRESGNSIVFRFATAYGVSPRMRIDLLPNDFVYKAVKERQLIVYEKSFKRPFAHVKDISKGIIFAMKNKDRMINQVYNLGSEESNVTKGSIVELIKAKAPDFILHYTDSGGQDDRRNFHVGYSKIQALGFKTNISLEAGINELMKGVELIDVSNPYINV